MGIGYEDLLSIKDILKDDLKYLISFIGKGIHCIKSFEKFDKGEFYIIDNISTNSTGLTIDELYEGDLTHIPLIHHDGDSFSYDYFFDFFELATKEDIRKRKIKSILD